MSSLDSSSIGLSLPTCSESGVFAASTGMVRVVKPGGRLQFADIVVGVELSEAARSDIDLWTG